MTKLETIADLMRKATSEKINQEAHAITKDLLSNVSAVRYPFKLFVQKWYIPFRAFYTFGVDTTQLAVYLGNGHDIKEINTSLQGEWLAVCVHEMNNVSLYDMDTGKHVMYIPPLLRMPTMRKDVDNANVEINSNFYMVAEKSLLQRHAESEQHEYMAFKNVEMAYDFEANKAKLREDWIKSLDHVDRLMGRSTEKMIEEIKSYLPMDILNPDAVKNLDFKSSPKTKEKNNEDLLSAFL